MPILNLQQLAIAALVGLVVGACGAWMVQGWRIDAIEAGHIEDKASAIEEEQKRANKISSDYAEVVTWLNQQKQSRTVTVVKELEKPVYRDAACVLPESGRLLVNEAVRQANASRFGGAVLPKDSGVAAAGDDGRATAVDEVGSGGLRGMLRWKSQADPVADGVAR